LTQPAAIIHDEDERRRVRLFSAVQFVLIIALIPPALKILPIDSEYRDTPFAMQWVAQTIAYGLSRTKYYRWGVFVSLAALFGMALGTGLQAPQFTAETMSLHFMWLVLPMLYGSMIFTQRQTAIMATAVFLGFVIFPLLVPDLGYIDIAPVMFFVGMWSVAHIFLLRQNEQVEINRRAELRQSAEKLRNTNQTLVLEIEERQQAQTQLAASLNEKEVLLKEIHHRVKNNLQVISSMLNLQSSTVSDEAALGVFQDSQNRVRSMALIHEKLYQSRNLAEIDFCDYVNNLVDYLKRSYRTPGVEIRVEGISVFLEIDTAVPCGLILNELVSNALKHAFPNEKTGEIIVELMCNQQQKCSLRVRDNGVGLPPDLDYLHTASLGLQLVHSLVEQINGRLHLDNATGTTFTVTFSEP
jgi:two-component sensor histidine kinase